MRANIRSSLPVSSPTVRRCEASGGNICVRASGCADSFAALDALRDIFQRIRHAAVEKNARGNMQRLHQRHAVADQRRHGAREARSLGFPQRVAENGEFQAMRVPPESSRRRSDIVAESDDDRDQDQRHQPPPVLHDMARLQHDQRRQRDLHAAVVEDAGEARDDEIQDHEDRPRRPRRRAAPG